jgi:thiamine kinase-like enzyme
MIERYSIFNYSKFKNSNKIFNEINEKLINYEKNKLGKKSIVHGDPVFTNILINQFGKIKFIDMRGKLGNKLTILGDSMYDWAKIYQSLVGYDEILEDIQLNLNYKNSLIEHFEQIFLSFNTQSDLQNLKIITKSLLFTLIPLHDNEKCQRYYDLIERI